MLKKYLLSILVLTGLLSFNFVSVFASLPSDSEKKQVPSENIVKEEPKKENKSKSSKPAPKSYVKPFSFNLPKKI